MTYAIVSNFVSNFYVFFWEFGIPKRPCNYLLQGLFLSYAEESKKGKDLHTPLFNRICGESDKWIGTVGFYEGIVVFRSTHSNHRHWPTEHHRDHQNDQKEGKYGSKCSTVGVIYRSPKHPNREVREIDQLHSRWTWPLRYIQSQHPPNFIWRWLQ